MTQNFEANWLLINVIDIDAIDYTSITYQAALPINYSLIRHIPGVLNWWQLIIVDINIYYAAYLLCKEYLNNFKEERTDGRTFKVLFNNKHQHTTEVTRLMFLDAIVID